MTTYVAVSWMARAFYFNNLDREMAQEIMEGKVAVELIRPYSYLAMKTMQGSWGRDFSDSFSFRCLGLLIVALVFPIAIYMGTQCLGTYLHYRSSSVFLSIHS